METTSLKMGHSRKRPRSGLQHLLGFWDGLKHRVNNILSCFFPFVIHDIQQHSTFFLKYFQDLIFCFCVAGFFLFLNCFPSKCGGCFSGIWRDDGEYYLWNFPKHVLATSCTRSRNLTWPCCGDDGAPEDTSANVWEAAWLRTSRLP